MTTIAWTASTGSIWDRIDRKGRCVGSPKLLRLRHGFIAGLLLLGCIQFALACKPIPPPSNPLHRAVWDGDWERTKRVLATGVDINSIEGGGTALEMALRDPRRLDLASKLVVQGVDTRGAAFVIATHSFRYGEAPIAIVQDLAKTLTGRPGVCNPSADYHRNGKPPFLHSSPGEIWNDSAKFLAKWLLEVCATDFPLASYQQLAFSSAIYTSYRPGGLDRVNIIQQLGGKPDSVELKRLFAFEHACLRGDESLVNWLKELGVSPDHDRTDDANFGQTFMHAAVRGDLDACVDIAIAGTRNINALLNSGYRAAPIGSVRSVRVLRRLVSAGANINFKDESGGTILHRQGPVKVALATVTR